MGTSTRRSTIWTADRPDAAARDCSYARCRQDGEHHFGSRPVALTVIGPRHQPHVDAANLRACPADSVGSAEPAAGSPDVEALGRRDDCGLRARPGTADWRDAFRRLPMRAMVRMKVPADVTPMRHDGTVRPSA